MRRGIGYLRSSLSPAYRPALQSKGWSNSHHAAAVQILLVICCLHLYRSFDGETTPNRVSLDSFHISQSSPSRSHYSQGLDNQILDLCSMIHRKDEAMVDVQIHPSFQDVETLVCLPAAMTSSLRNFV